MGHNLLVSICCATYNHELYIAKAIEGFLGQKANFTLEILIHDDASTDKTAQIVKHYADQHPDIIKPIFQNENQYSKFKCGISARFVYPRARGKYIAICDGDDYWSDPNKLQKQINFLETHGDYMLCAGRSLISNGNNIPDFGPCQTGTITFKDVACSNFIITNTVVFRNIFRDHESSKISNYLLRTSNGDIFLFLALLEKGKGYILPDYVGVRTKHAGGIYSQQSDFEKYSRSLKTRNVFIQYLKDIGAGESYIKDVEQGYLSMLESYLNNNILTEEFMKIIPKHILDKAMENAMNNRQQQMAALNDKISQNRGA